MAMTNRVRLTALLLAALTALSGCASDLGDSDENSWKRSRLYIATGNTTGVYYQIGGGYADIITKHLPGYEATAEPTAAAVDNIRRVGRGDADLGLVSMDGAAEAIAGVGQFNGQAQPIRALAKIYPSYMHVVVRKDAGIKKFADLKGKKISLSAKGSGSEFLGTRMLKAAGIETATEPMAISEQTKRVADGRLDAMFLAVGLPATGIKELVELHKEKVEFLDTSGVLPLLQKNHPNQYRVASIAKSVYSQPADTPTIVYDNLLVASDRMSDQLAFDLTRVLLEHTAELEKIHPDAKNIARKTAPDTSPVPLHPGARRYFGK